MIEHLQEQIRTRQQNDSNEPQLQTRVSKAVIWTVTRLTTIVGPVEDISIFFPTSYILESPEACYPITVLLKQLAIEIKWNLLTIGTSLS
ncbi:hypothetical protein SCLCIDRAFT_1218714 [Scleroderma citrinum Foug A]|uniref:Uncharacterized protein n=1 Tax=Scleroderma citrinum Foug A TaxID=1036808 RepID=A0A0C3DQU1_9AGAM|nr:hypothetical protein SCLCIDRAFT_1218714 [Scleroderma citrinum Foug A]